MKKAIMLCILLILLSTFISGEEVILGTEPITPAKLNFSWQGGYSGYYNLSSNNPTFWVTITPYIIDINNNPRSVQWIKDNYPSVTFSQYVIPTTYEAEGMVGFKYGINLSSIPANLTDKVRYIAFVLTDSSNITWSNVSLDKQNKAVTLFDDIRISYYDLVESNFTVSLYNKSVILIGNVTNKTELFLDPTITLTSTDVIADTYVNQDLPATNYGSATTINVGNSLKQRGYIKYNLTDLLNLSMINITNAEWHFYNKDKNPNHIWLYEVFDNSWNETNITWNNQPCPANISSWNSSNCNNTLIDNTSVAGESWATLNITALVRSYYLNNNDTLNFVLISNYTDKAKIRPKEAGNNHHFINTTYVDLTPPTTNATAVKNDSTLYIFNTWTSSSYVNVTLSCDDGSGVGCNVTQYCTDTNNTCTPNITYSAPVHITTEGTSYIRFRSNDTVGNLETTKSETIKIDTTAPTTTATAVDDTGSSYTFNTWTSSSYVNVTLNCSDNISGCNVTQYCTDTVNTCTPSTTYSAPVQISTGGTSYIRFRSNDSVGNLETTKSETIKIDTTAPTVILVSPPDNNWTLDDPINFIFYYTNNDATANCKLYIDEILADANATTQNNTNTTLQGSGVTEGNHTWQINCTDAVGNEGASAIRDIYVDRTKPTITLNSPATGNYTSNNQPTFNFTATDNMDTIMGCELFIDNIGYGTTTANNNTPTTITANDTLTDGIHYWNITCSDELQSNTSETRNITVDTQIPTVYAMSPLDNNWTNATSVNFIFNVTDNSATLFCRLYINDVLADANGTTLNNTPTTLTASPPEGNHTWYVNCTDNASNTGQSTPRNLLVDRTKPSIILHTPLNNDVTTNVTPAFNFTVTDNLDSVMDCELFIDSIGYGTTTANNNTPTTITANDTLSYTLHTWYINCSDVLFTTKSEERNLTIGGNVSLVTGWNLFSLYANDSYDSETLCQVVSGCTVISKFENQKYVSHIKGLPFHIFPLTPGYGFFMHSSQTSTIPLSGSRITTPTKNITIELERGWNIIAWTSETNTTAEAVCDDIPARYIAKYSATGFTTHLKDNPSNNFTVSEGNGYFVWVNQTLNWTHN